MKIPHFPVRKIIRFAFWLFILILSIFSLLVFYYYKFDKNLEFQCPNEFTESNEYTNSVARWTNSYLKDHPNATQEEIITERIRLLKEFNCTKSSFEYDGESQNNLEKSNVKSTLNSSVTLPSSGYSLENEVLPPVRTYAEIFKDSDGDGKIDWEDLYKDQIKKYGDLATRFIYKGYIIDTVEQFDVDSDGQKETIIFICGTGGNHCPHEILVVKNDRVIFNAHAGLTDLGLEKSLDGNGFYVKWVPSDATEGTIWDTGLCCSPGYRKTKFIYENGTFKPVDEKEVLYPKDKYQ
jgi:hypothetical protein